MDEPPSAAQEPLRQLRTLVSPALDSFKRTALARVQFDYWVQYHRRIEELFRGYGGELRAIQERHLTPSQKRLRGPGQSVVRTESWKVWQQARDREFWERHPMPVSAPQPTPDELTPLERLLVECNPVGPAAKFGQPVPPGVVVAFETALDVIDSLVAAIATPDVSAMPPASPDAQPSLAEGGGLTVTQAAQLLGWDKSKVTRWCDAGKLESVGHGRDRRITESSVTGLLLEDESEAEVKERLRRLREQRGRNE